MLPGLTSTGYCKLYNAHCSESLPNLLITVSDNLLVRKCPAQWMSVFLSVHIPSCPLPPLSLSP